jgi:hypothetical protein
MCFTSFGVNTDYLNCRLQYDPYYLYPDIYTSNSYTPYYVAKNGSTSSLLTDKDCNLLYTDAIANSKQRDSAPEPHLFML